MRIEMPEKRKKYDAGQIDADGNEQFRGFGGGRASGSPFGQGGSSGFGFSREGGPGGRANFEGVDLDEIFGMFGGGGSPMPTAAAAPARPQLAQIQLEPPARPEGITGNPSGAGGGARGDQGGPPFPAPPRAPPTGPGPRPQPQAPRPPWTAPD